MTTQPSTWQPLPETVDYIEQWYRWATNGGPHSWPSYVVFHDMLQSGVPKDLAFCRGVLVRAGRIKENDDG